MYLPVWWFNTFTPKPPLTIRIKNTLVSPFFCFNRTHCVFNAFKSKKQGRVSLNWGILLQNAPHYLYKNLLKIKIQLIDSAAILACIPENNTSNQLKHRTFAVFTVISFSSPFRLGIAPLGLS